MIEPQKWASTLGSQSDTVTLPDEDLQFASFKKLFPALTQVPLSEGGVAPQRTDFNTLFKLLGDNIFYIQQGGVFSYSDKADYERGAFVKYNNELYLCIQDNSSLNKHAPNDKNYWEKISSLNLKADKDFSNIDNTAKIAIARNSMPSNIYDDLTLGASGTSYTAPANGYVALNAISTSASDIVTLFSRSLAMRAYSSSWTTTTYTAGLTVWIPIMKGEIFTVDYTNGINGVHYFRFNYAVGSQSEKV